MGSYGNESYYGTIDLGGQFDENNIFGYRVNALYQNGELPNESEKDQKAISLVFDYKPTDKFYTDIKYFFKDTLTKGANTYFITWNSGFDRSSIKKNKNYNPNWIESDIKSNKFENNIKWDINDIFTLRTNIFYEKIKHKGDDSRILYQDNKLVIDPSTSWNTSLFYKGAWQETKNYGANLFLDSKFDTGNVNHILSMGYTYSSSKNFTHSDGWSYYIPSNDMSLDEFKNFKEPDSSLWSSTLGTQPLKPSSKIQYKNILIGDDIVFNDQWSALVGVNYATTINKSYMANTKYDKSELTPTLSLVYKPFENLTTYTTYIESLEAGTIVGSRFANENEILDPYKSTQYEIGVKYSMLDERALLTASLFRIEKANSYEDTSSVASLGKPTLTQDGEQIHQGIELGVTGKITDNLTLMGGLTLMDLSLKKHTNPNLEGKKPTEASTKMGKLYAEYNIPYIQGLTITGGAYYTGKRYYNSLNTDIMPSYTLYDAGLRYKTKIDKYPTTFNLNVQNITDEVYWIEGTMLGDPRSVAFSMKMEF